MSKIIYLIIFLLVIMILFIRTSSGTVPNKKEIINTLIRQSARWSIASQQDTNVLIAVLHANYGAGYLWALRDIATDDEITKSSGINILKFRDEIIKVQDSATRRLNGACPKFAIPLTYLGKIAGDIDIDVDTQ